MIVGDYCWVSTPELDGEGVIAEVIKDGDEISYIVLRHAQKIGPFAADRVTKLSGFQYDVVMWCKMDRDRFREETLDLYHITEPYDQERIDRRKKADEEYARLKQRDARTKRMALHPDAVKHKLSHTMCAVLYDAAERNGRAPYYCSYQTYQALVHRKLVERTGAGSIFTTEVGLKLANRLRDAVVKDEVDESAR